MKLFLLNGKLKLKYNIHIYITHCTFILLNNKILIFFFYFSLSLFYIMQLYLHVKV